MLTPFRTFPRPIFDHNMSLLRVCRPSASALRIARAPTLTHLARNASTSTETPATAEKQLQDKTVEKPGDLAVQPVRDVMVADVISGAPCMPTSGAMVFGN